MTDHMMFGHNWTTYNRTPHIRLKELCGRGGGETVRPGTSGVRLCLVYRTGSPQQSQQYGCPKKTQTMTTAVDMSMWMGKSHKAPPLKEKLQTVTTWERENQSSPRMTLLIGHPTPSGQIHIINTKAVCTSKFLWMYICNKNNQRIKGHAYEMDGRKET